MASYFKTEDHFSNFIAKVYRENLDLETDKVMPMRVYIDAAFNGGLADEFGIALRGDATLLHEDRFWAWMQRQSRKGFALDQTIAQILSPEIHDRLSSLSKIPGVYSFWNEGGQPLYIGTSIDLASRVMSSFSERFRHYPNVVNLRYFATKTASDAVVLESVAIAVLKPALNCAGKFNDLLTIDVTMPDFSDPIPMNLPGEKVWENGFIVVKEVA